MSAIDIGSNALFMLAEISASVDHALGDPRFSGTTTTVIDAVDGFAPVTFEDTPTVVPMSNEYLNKITTVATIDDCKKSEDSCNTVSNNMKHIFSVLHSILGVNNAFIPITILRRFATKVGLTGYGKK